MDIDIPFWKMTDEEKAEITPYIQKFIDNCTKEGVEVVPVSAYNLDEETFCINYTRPDNDWLQWKRIYRGEEGRRKHNERLDREFREDFEE